jgi:hypothetical protein
MPAQRAFDRCEIIALVYVSIVTRMGWLKLYGFRIDDRIYWTFLYSEWLHFTIHYYTHTRARKR